MLSCYPMSNIAIMFDMTSNATWSTNCTIMPPALVKHFSCGYDLKNDLQLGK